MQMQLTHRYSLALAVALVSDGIANAYRYT